MAANVVGLAAGSLVLATLLWPPLVHAGAPERVRSPEGTTAIERALTGGLVTLRSPGSLMIRVAAASFSMGSTADETLAAAAMCAREPLTDHCDASSFRDELPQHSVKLLAFWLDRTEVTASDYDRCAARGRCTPRPLSGGARRFARQTWPATLVTAAEAAAYCEARGARLPTEVEFERAARGTSGRVYPWGNFYNGHLANHGRGGVDETDDRDGYAELAPVGSFPQGATPDGFLDLAGNAAEWTSDRYSTRYDLGPEPNAHDVVVRGGSYESSAAYLRGAARTPHDPDERSPLVGFRCARSFDNDDADDQPAPATPLGGKP